MKKQNDIASGAEPLEQPGNGNRRVHALVVCLCGSTRFRDEFTEHNRRLTMEGKIVVAPGVFAHSGDPLTDEDKERLDELHLRKIDLSDSVLGINPNGYIGDSTRREIAYAERIGKPIYFTHNAQANSERAEHAIERI